MSVHTDLSHSYKWQHSLLPYNDKMCAFYHLAYAFKNCTKYNVTGVKMHAFLCFLWLLVELNSIRKVEIGAQIQNYVLQWAATWLRNRMLPKNVTSPFEPSDSDKSFSSMLDHLFTLGDWLRGRCDILETCKSVHSVTATYSISTMQIS